jgi:hypothetical protein
MIGRRDLWDRTYGGLGDEDLGIRKAGNEERDLRLEIWGRGGIRRGGMGRMGVFVLEILKDCIRFSWKC